MWLGLPSNLAIGVTRANMISQCDDAVLDAGHGLRRRFFGG